MKALTTAAHPSYDDWMDLFDLKDNKNSIKSHIIMLCIVQWLIVLSDNLGQQKLYI